MYDTFYLSVCFFFFQDDNSSPRRNLEREYRRQQLEKQALNYGKRMSDLRTHEQSLKQQREGKNETRPLVNLYVDIQLL